MRLIYDSLTTQVDGSRRSISAAECSPLSAALLKLGEQKGRSSILGERRGSSLLAKAGTLLQAAARHFGSRGSNPPETYPALALRP